MSNQKYIGDQITKLRQNTDVNPITLASLQEKRAESAMYHLSKEVNDPLETYKIAEAMISEHNRYQTQKNSTPIVQRVLNTVFNHFSRKYDKKDFAASYEEAQKLKTLALGAIVKKYCEENTDMPDAVAEILFEHFSDNDEILKIIMRNADSQEHADKVARILAPKYGGCPDGEMSGPVLAAILGA